SLDIDIISDEELVLCFQAGDKLAFNILVHRYYPRIYRYVMAMVGDDYASDLTQDTFLKAYECLQDIRSLTNLKGWLYKVARNLVIDYQRRRRRICWFPWTECKDINREGSVLVVGPEQQIEGVEFIDRIMAQVAPKYRPCLYLHIFEELKHWEIAAL